MWWLQGALGVALLPKVWSQTDAFEFSWPGDTDQCGVSDLLGPTDTWLILQTYDLTWNGGSPPFRAFFVLVCICRQNAIADKQTDRRCSHGIRYP